jgi:hypothetical protein
MHSDSVGTVVLGQSFHDLDIGTIMLYRDGGFAEFDLLPLSHRWATGSLSLDLQGTLG